MAVQKVEEGQIHSLDLSWDISPLGSQAFRLQLGSIPLVSPGSRAFGLRLNYTTGFPRSLACRQWIVDFSASFTPWLISVPPLYISIYLHRCIGSVSPENPTNALTFFCSWQEILLSSFFMLIRALTLLLLLKHGTWDAQQHFQVVCVNEFMRPRCLENG